MQSQVRFNRICGHLTYGNPAEVFPALGFAACFRKICKNKTLRLLGIPPKFFFYLDRILFEGEETKASVRIRKVSVFFLSMENLVTAFSCRFSLDKLAQIGRS